MASDNKNNQSEPNKNETGTQKVTPNELQDQFIKPPQAQQITPIPVSQPGFGPENVPAQKGSREAEDYALSIAQLLDQRRINVDRLQIDVNGQTVFKLRDGDIDQSKTSINNEQTELLKKALSDPAALNGSVKITQGNQVLLHVKDGRVLIDSAGLTKQSAKVEVRTPDSPSEGLYERSSKDVISKGLQATKEIATNALKSGIEREQVVDLLKSRDPAYQKLANEQGKKVADPTLEKLVDSAQASLLLEQLPEQQKSEKIKTSKSAKL